MKDIMIEKKQRMEKLADEKGVINALAIDQRGALRKMMTALGKEATTEDIEQFKILVSKCLTKYASSILLDPEFGLPGAKQRDENCGLILAYEKTGYDATVPGRLPDLLSDWSVQRLKAEGADAIKFLLYYDIDEDAAINHKKHVFVERLASECEAEGLPFFLELLSYDATNSDNSSIEFAKVKPRKVIEMMKEFSKPQYKVDVLKVEVPVNMNFVEGYAKGEVVHTRQEALELFKLQSEATHLPFIFLSAGVSSELFVETLKLVKEAGATFNGVLCGRATWQNGVKAFVEGGESAALEWFEAEGKQNILSLGEVVSQCSTPWFDR